MKNKTSTARLKWVSSFRFLAVTLCLFLSGCIPEKNSGDADAARVIIAGRTFKVPKSYFNDGIADGRDIESALLEYSLPGFEPLPPHPQYRKERQELINEGRMRGMLLENASKRPSFDIAVKNHMSSTNFIKEKNAVYGLEKYVHLTPKPISSDRAYTPYLEDDFFIEKNPDDSIKSYLRCSPPGKDKVPSCKHRFIDKGLLYDISWKISELPNWKEQRDSAIQFIDSLERK